jgi:leucyl-tRNA synthetase
MCPADAAVREAAEAIAISLSLVAPYTAEDMWEKLGHQPAIANAGWPTVDPALLEDDSVEVVLQINGKIIDRIDVSPSISKDDLEKAAKGNAKIAEALSGAEIKKAIVGPPKLVNFVI